MPRFLNRLPKYRRHSTRDVAFVVLAGKRNYLPGRYGSAESRREYGRLVLEWTSQGKPSAPPPPASTVTISELILAYWRFAKQHYVKHGEPTSEQDAIRSALRPLRKLYGQTPASEFGPKRLAAVREQMIADGLARTTINKNSSRIRRFFRWAVAEEMLPVAVWQALGTLPGLQRGRTKARETKPIPPVDEATVEATLPFLPPVVADMVRVQLATGMRPAEVCLLRPCDVDRSRDVWQYLPSQHKTEHRGRERIVFLGPKAQELLQPYLNCPEDALCFSPAASEQARRARAHTERRTPLAQGNTIGTNRKRRPRRQPGDGYGVAAYRRAITRGCELAFRMPEHLRDKPKPGNGSDEEVTRRRREAAEWRARHCWSPNQLRHTAATRIREKFGVEAAQVILGHAAPDTTLIYAERSEKLAADVARQLG